MSWVTNVILHIGFGDTDKLQRVNEFFERDEIRGFVSLSDESLPRGWYGGTKYLEAYLSVGAFNHLNLNHLLDYLRSIQWSQPESVQLMIKAQEDYKFRIIELFPNEQALYEQQSE